MALIYRFGACELDVERRELRDGGITTAVEPQVFDVLAYLVGHRDRVVSKEELLDNVWGDRFVSESALTSRIKSARRAVGDTGQSQHVIRTVHGRGYHFVAPVSILAPAARHAERSWPGAVSPFGLVPEAHEPTGRADPAAPGRAWPLLGRVRELDSIGDAYRAGDYGGVLLTGPAGVGKTRLAQECLRLAEQAGIPVARVSGHHETRPLPLAALAHLLPPDVARGTGPEGELDRGALFHRARAAFERGSGRDRAMVLVDDIDQVDELSRALIVSLIHARTVFVVATLRTSDGEDEGVSRLVKDQHLRSLDVEGLTADTVGTLLPQVLGGPVEGASLLQLVEASVGNPGVLRQLVESSWEAGTLTDRDGRWMLDSRLVHASPTLELLVGERLAGLDDHEREAVELLAVAGELALAILASIVEEAVLERLERRGLLQVVEVDQRTEITLAHPLFAEVLRAQLPTMRGRRLRRTLADAVTAQGSSHRRDQIRVVAWRLEAGGQVDAGLLAEAARLALIDADEAMAERILDRADSVDRTPETVQLLAELKFRRGETDAVENLLASIDDDELEDQVRAEVVRRRATNLFYGRGQFLEGLDLLTRGFELISDVSARQSLQGYHVLLLAMAGLVDEAIGCSDDLLDELDGASRLELFRGRALALAAGGRGEDALTLVAEGWDIHRSLAPDLVRPGLSLLLFTEVLALGELGRLDEAAVAARRAIARRPETTTTGWIALAQARGHLAAGRPGIMRHELEPLVKAARSVGQGATERWALAYVACARLLQNDHDGAAEDLARVATLEGGARGLFHPDIDRAHAWLAAEDKGSDRGCELLLAAAADARRLGKYALEGSLLHDVVRFGQAAEVAGRLRELAQISQGALPQARALHAAGAAGATDTLAEAVTIFERCGTLLLAAEVATERVRCLVQQTGDREEVGAARQRAASLRAALPGGITTLLLAAGSSGWAEGI